ncbi:hypothetical protein Pla110_21660 [Polystyrenella longa]|uniref:Glycoside hydrolase family 38 N-terminal domain-containing protein n=1 Tax=Polystyrenella longa TaxID=2528007 RepID=A0A518CMI1_9PLAN|nr:hypothetical protein [Polystyrenella longa]QDU80436.1 hypothetical protein Pla110_21660 [Polystyrenella longa]
MSYQEICTLIPTYDLEDFPTDLEESQAESLLNCFAVMWHPLLIANMTQLPSWRRLESEPEIFADRLVFVPTACSWISPDFADRVLENGGTVIEGLVTRDEWIEAIHVVLRNNQPTLYKRPPQHDQEHDFDYVHDDGHSPSVDDQLVLTDPHEAASQLVSDLMIKTRSELLAEAKSESVSEADDAQQIIEETADTQNIPEVVDLSEMLSRLSPDLERDFMALGFAYLQIELLSRQMHHFSSVDDIALRLSASKAAKSALEGDEPAARRGLSRCFELLQDVREIFYPVESYLVDLCLLAPDSDPEKLKAICEQASRKHDREETGEEEPAPGSAYRHPVNFMLSAAELQELDEAQPEACAELATTWNQGKIDFCGGEQLDRPASLLPVESVLWNFNKGHETYERILNQRPKMWARRRFGFSTLLPMLLKRMGYKSALHFALDDGIYPDEEHTRFQWEGADGSFIDTCSRIPMAADSASSFLKFPQRLSESMQGDNVAGVILARYPEEKTPWMEDLRRIAAYAPVLGKFVTWSELFNHKDHYSKQSRYSQKEYLSPVLIQRVAYELSDPISQFREHYGQRAELSRIEWATAIERILRSKPLENAELYELEEAIEAIGPVSELTPPSSWNESQQESESDTDEEKQTEFSVDVRLDKALNGAVQQLASMLAQGAGDRPGSLLFNPLPHSRRTVVFWPEGASLPEVSDVVRAVQGEGPRKVVVVDLPASGFTWLADATSPHPSLPELRFPAVEENILRNEFFEVHINPSTGGIAKIKGMERSPVRLSQQVAYRFPREQEYVFSVDGESKTIQSFYSEPVCRRCDLTATGPVMNEITTETDLYDPVRSLKLARVKQVTRVYRGCKFVDVELELDVKQMPLADPWSNYYGIRFAWNDAGAAVTRSIQHAGFSFQEDRFESTEYIEIAEEENQTTILMPGMPFHRAQGSRMLDTLLITGKESARKFQFRISLDESAAGYALNNYTQPPVLLSEQPGPPASGQSGWFFHFNSRHVQLLRFLPAAPLEEEDSTHAADDRLKYGFCMRVMETSGIKRQLQIKTYRPAQFARQRDYTGRTITELLTTEEGVSVYLSPYEVAEIEIWFG